MVKITVGRGGQLQSTEANIVQSLVIKTEGAVGVLKKRVRRQHVVVRLNDSSGNLRSRSHSEGKLGLTTIVNGKTLKKKRTETGTTSTTGGMEDHETLKTGTVISKLADSVQNKVNNLLTNGVVTTGVVVSSIFLTGDDLLRVVKLAVGTGTDLIAHSRLKIDKHSTRNVLTGTGLREESVERIITTTDGLVRRHLTIRLDTVFKAVQLPATVTGLDTSLTNVDRKTLTHFEF
mmetsp:Transcript_5592/g.9172  ORF Transcript_5592/g.9172 Transcript_5592/m.9172 type:complete len:233 (-) Transcript_5592:79-777(-)